MALCFDPKAYDVAMDEIEEYLANHEKKGKKHENKNNKKVYLIK